VHAGIEEHDAGRVIDDEAHRRHPSELAAEAAAFEQPDVDVDVAATGREESHVTTR
jgi:hypothetical protein